MQADAVSNCARILLQVTKDWRPADGSDATLGAAREALAGTILAAGGAGFPPPASDAIVARPDLDAAWRACVTAARAASAKPPGAPAALANVVCWTAETSDPNRVGDRAGLGLNWPFLPGSHVATVSGPLMDGTGAAPKRLFFFDAVDPAALDLDRDAGPGFWPRMTLVDGAPAPAPSAGPVPDRRRPGLAGVLFVAWLVSGCYAAAWSWFAVEFARETAPEAPWLRSLFWTPLGADDKHFSLILPFGLIMASMLLLVLSAGLARKGLWFGALIDERNRLSLNRTQQVGWSILLLGGLGTVGWLNAAIGVDRLQDLFPHMDPSLWAALGINLALSPFLSDTILNAKEATLQPGTGAATPMVTKATLDRKDSAVEASLLDLVAGETAGTQDVVDVSRLQHLVISGLLWTTYLIELGKLLTVIDLSPKLIPDMPPAGTTFLGLLAFSHAGYLVFKARAPEATTPTK